MLVNLFRYYIIKNKLCFKRIYYKNERQFVKIKDINIIYFINKLKEKKFVFLIDI